MSEATTYPVIEPTPLVRYARIDPPAEVVASVSALRAACDGWKPSKVGVGLPLYPHEAQICDQLTGVTHPAESAFNDGIVAGVIGTLIVIGICIVVRDVYRGLRALVRSRLLPRPSE